MPVLEYGCEDCKVTTKHVIDHEEERPESFPCRICEEPAIIGLMPVKDGYRRVGEITRSIHSFRCTECDHEFDATVYNAKESPRDGKDCPECGSMSAWFIDSAQIDTSDMRYPYFDRGLGMWVNSKSHRAEICREPRRFGINSDGLTPVDGDWDADKEINKRKAKEDALLKGYDEYADRLENHPAFRSWRKARDQGRV